VKALPICKPLKLPGTRFAREHHGGRAGRIWRVDWRMIEGFAVLLPRRCPKCNEIYTYDQREVPCCPICGEPPEELPQREADRVRRFRRLKAAKKARIIHKC